jgi:peptidoglycan/LPS O-acetylase OafA/YrhL
MFMLPTPQSWSIMPDRLFPLNDPSWSLLLELAVNVAFAALILILSNRVLIALIALGLAGTAAFSLAAGTIDFGFTWDSFLAGFPRVTFGFFAGVLVHRVWTARGARIIVSGGVASLGGWLLAGTMLAAMLAPVQPHWRAIHEVAVAALLFPALVYAAACLAPSGITMRVFAALGAASYGVYVMHMPAARAFNHLLMLVDLDAHILAPWAGLAFAGLLVAGCLALDRMFDRPVREWLTARLVRRPKIRPASRAPRADWPRHATR